jgi:membrane protein implicated in regulation of membrane protease activity
MTALKRVAMIGGFLAGALVVAFFSLTAVVLLVLGGVPWYVLAIGSVFAFCVAVWLVLRFRRRGSDAVGGFSESVFSDRSSGKGGLL